MKTVRLLLFAGFVFLLSCSQETPPGGEAYVSEKDLEELPYEDTGSVSRVPFSKEEFRGMKLYMRHCNQCHPGGEKGKGPSLSDKKLPDFVVHFQIRNGLGDMPAFKEKNLSKEDVKRIVKFVRWLRKNTPQ